MPAQYSIFTTGYAGHDIDSFVNKLRLHGVQRVIDVRQNPVSRKKGFSKSRLAEFLHLNGIGYVHLRELGVPRELRDRLRNGACTLGEYLAAFRNYVVQQDEALAAVEALVACERCCLLCLEARPEDCHRAVVADVLAARASGELEILHV
jgi:uncharacterized protein (DUF488 family)